MNSTSILRLCFALLALCFIPRAHAGTPTENDQTGNGVYTVSTTNNLILTHLASAAYTGTAGTEGYANPTTGSTVLTDGAFGPAAPSATPAAVATLSDGFVAVFNFDLAASPNGYLLSRIESHGGWNDAGRDQQSYTVAYQPLGGGAFVNLATVNYNPPGGSPSNTFVTLSNLGIPNIAVQAVRFTINAQENGYCGYREFSVIGAPILNPVAPPAADSATGARGRMYYDVGGGGTLPDFSTATLIHQQVRPTHFIASTDPHTTNPFEPARGTNYSVQFSGYITIATEGLYTFYTASDDGSRLFIGSTLVVENNFSQGVTERGGLIGLKVGKHPLLVQFGQGGGGAGLSTSYEGPGIAKTQIPSSVLTTEPAGSDPIISIAGGGTTFTTQTTVTISSDSGNPALPPTIYYTLDGSTPTADSHTGVYTGPFTISATTTVKALAVVPTGSNSILTTATFTRTPAATDAPKLLFARAVSTTQVDAVFDRAMGVGTGVPANYVLNNGATVTGAVLDADGITVHLTLGGALDPIFLYTLTVNGVSSAAGTPIGPTNLTKFRLLPNGVYFERFYSGAINANIDSLLNHASYPNSPTNRDLLPTFDFPEGRYGDNYGARLRAYLLAPETGTYTFRISSDDNSRLFVGTDATPASAVGIAGVPNWTPYRNFTTFAEDGDANPFNDQFGTVSLTAGQMYYIEAIMSEGGGGDHLTVQWALPADPANFGDIPSSALIAFSNTGLTSPVVANGMLRERYNGITGTAIANLTNSPKYPGSPDVVDFVTTFESPQTPALGDNYGLRLSGFYTAPASGDFNFYVCGDDDCELWFSPNDNPANATRICFKVGGPYGNREWTTGNAKSANIALVAGTRYYMFALMKEGGGGDGVAVTVLPSGTDPVANPNPIANPLPVPTDTLPAVQVGAQLTPGVLPLQILTQTLSKRVRYGSSTTLVLSATGGVVSKTFQWFKNGVKLSGQTANTLTLNNVTGADTATYTCEVYGSADGIGLSTAVSLPIAVQVFAEIALDTATLTQTYNSTNRVVTATTTPAALPYAVTYNGQPQAVNAGTYPVVASTTGGVEAIANGSLVVNPAALTVTAENKTREYGQANPVFTATVTGFFSTDAALLTGGANYSTAATPTSGVGTYAIVPAQNDYDAGGNYIFPPANFINGTLTITQATGATVTVNPQGGAITYDGLPHALTASTTPAGLNVTFTYNGAASAVNANTYTVVATISDANAAGNPTGNGTLVIDKAPLTVATLALTRVYGDTAPIVPAAPALGTHYMLNGFVNNETAAVVSGSPLLSTTAVAATTGPDSPGSAVGSYPLNIAAGSLAAANYTFGGFSASTLSITQRPLDLQASSISLEYGQPNPPTLPFTVVAASLAPGDTQGDALLGGNPALSSTRTPTSPVGTYPITLTSGTLQFSANYQLGATTGGTLTVIPASSATVAVPDLTVTYNGSPQSSAAAVTTPAGLNATFTYNGSPTVPTNAGVYTVVATINDPNATGNPQGSGTLTINKAAAQVAITNLFQAENGTPRSVTVLTVPSNLNVNVTYNGSTTPPVQPGIYTVVATINETNYQGTSTETLRVGGPPPLITSPLTATPSSVQVGKPVLFSIAATHPLGLPLTITYDYGDGISDATGQHTYNFPTIATVTASVSDGVNTITSTTTVLVFSAASPDGDIDGDGVTNGLDVDSDGDGVSNSLEEAWGSSPMDPGSSPLSSPATGLNPGALDVKKMSIKLNFSRLLSDNISISGTLPVKAGFTSANQRMMFDIGGVVKIFTLNAKFGAKTATESIKVGVKARKGVVAAQNAKFMFKAKGTFFNALADDGLANETVKGKSATVRVDVIFNGELARKLVPQLYTARQGATGRTK